MINSDSPKSNFSREEKSEESLLARICIPITDDQQNRIRMMKGSW